MRIPKERDCRITQRVNTRAHKAVHYKKFRYKIEQLTDCHPIMREARLIILLPSTAVAIPFYCFRPPSTNAGIFRCSAAAVIIWSTIGHTVHHKKDDMIGVGLPCLLYRYNHKSRYKIERLADGYIVISGRWTCIVITVIHLCVGGISVPWNSVGTPSYICSAIRCWKAWKQIASCYLKTHALGNKKHFRYKIER